MKNTLKTILIAAIITVTVSSCQKYADGPMVSFHTRAQRVANTWKVDNYKVNGTDYTTLLSDYTETWSKEGGYSYAWGVFNGTGNWVFQNNDAEIRITGSSNQDNETLYILKLEETQFWYYILDGNDRREFHLIQQ